VFVLKLGDVSESFLLLCADSRFEAAAEVVERSLKHLQTADEYMAILELLRQVPLSVLLDVQCCRVVFTKVLVLNGLDSESLRFVEQCRLCCSRAELAQVQLEYCLILESNRSFADLKLLLEEVVPRLEGECLGRGLVLLGRAFFELQMTDWQVFFERGLGLLQGLGRARALITFGYCLSEAGLVSRAEAVWLEALPLVRHRARTTAHIFYNLGVVAQRFFKPEAEGFFLELERVSRHPAAVALRAAAWLGVGLARRVRGEWSRAEAAYEVALSAAELPEDRSAAYRGLARVYLLSGRDAKALKILDFALTEPDLDPDLLCLTKAQVLLAQGWLEDTRVVLGLIVGVQKESVRWSLAILRAELARLAGQLELIPDLLAGLPLDSLVAREEAGRLKALMALLPDQPLPLEYHSKLVVRVEAMGLLKVKINGVGVLIPPSGKVAELLVFLLEHNGSNPEQICLALYKGVDVRKAKRRLWNLVGSLRQCLGWEGSVRIREGSFWLDSDATWEYDMSEARAEKTFNGVFFSGVSSQWVLETNRALNGLVS
jgi:tetratricopeptide (TPR) repeat protein